MNEQQKVWDEVFKAIPLKTPKIDNWLDKYLDTISDKKHLLTIDLGCGFGNDSLYLLERGFNVMSCDFSEQALYRVKKLIKGARTKQVDMLNPLPFSNESVSVIICDLSLHYFNNDDTKRIIKELQRVLITGGYLICRVNSLKELEKNKKSCVVEKIEDNYYLVNNKLKRFFSEANVRQYFKDFNLFNIHKYIMPRYSFDKEVLDFMAQKR